MASSSTGPAGCGDGVVSGDEECDDGNSIPDDGCTDLCRLPACGDGIVQKGEDCDIKLGGSCTPDCHCGTPCGVPIKTFAKVVSNAQNPNKPGPGIAANVSYNGLVGLAAAKALCQAVGANEVCSYWRVRAAQKKGELANLDPTRSYWLYRTTYVADPSGPPKSCAKSSDCPGGACAPLEGVCGYKPDPAARCQDYGSASAAADGEWFEVYQPGGKFNAGGVHLDSLIFHFDADPQTSCNDPTKLGCAGGCDVVRDLVCCYPACTCGAPCSDPNSCI